MGKHVFVLCLALIQTHFCVMIYASICSQTPHPELCNPLTPKNGSVDDLYDASLRETLSHAQKIYKFISSINVASFQDKTKTALNDCVHLYGDSIYQLNRSIVSKNNHFDVKTWLSAAIANEQTCENGFLDFDMQPPLFFSQSPLGFTQNNHVSLSDFLSNALAINKLIPNTINAEEANDDFPEWVSAGDRKLLQSSMDIDIVVAKDGSSRYQTISQGLDAAAVAAHSKLKAKSKRIVIYVKKGVYKETVKVKRSLKNIMLIGDGIDATIITGSNSYQDGYSTYGSATFAISGDGFIARGITFENTAGTEKHQAVALMSSSDRSVFYNCSFKGYQDTLYMHAHRQFYRNCDIYGTVDFIFGFAPAVVQNCNIFLRQPMPKQKVTVTAQGRKNPNAYSGIIIHNSHITAAPAANINSTKCYLGRPWKKFSRTVFIKCVIDDVIEAEGWAPWKGNFALDTLYYGEYMNTGGGANTTGRVNWPGLHTTLTADEAQSFTVGNFLEGQSWLPATGVPFQSGL